MLPIVRCKNIAVAVLTLYKTEPPMFSSAAWPQLLSHRPYITVRLTAPRTRTLTTWSTQWRLGAEQQMNLSNVLHYSKAQRLIVFYKTMYFYWFSVLRDRRRRTSSFTFSLIRSDFQSPRIFFKNFRYVWQNLCICKYVGMSFRLLV